MAFKSSTITPRMAGQLFIGLILFEILLVVIYIAVNLSDFFSLSLYELFDLDREKNIPAIFSALQLMAIGGILILTIFSQHPATAHPSGSLLGFCGLMFIFFSVDEAVGIHEQITKILRRTDWIPRFGFKGDRGMWIFPYLFAGLVLAIVIYRFKYEDLSLIWSSYRREAIVALAGGGLFLSGAMGLEIVSYQFLRDDLLSVLYKVEVAAEEFLEMAGASVILYAVILFSLKETTISNGRGRTKLGN